MMAVSKATYWYRCWFIHNHNIVVHKNDCDLLTSYWNFMSGNTTHSMYDLSYLINFVKEMGLAGTFLTVVAKWIYQETFRGGGKW